MMILDYRMIYNESNNEKNIFYYLISNGVMCSSGISRTTSSGIRCSGIIGLFVGEKVGAMVGTLDGIGVGFRVGSAVGK